MALAAGCRLGPYEVVEAVGTGGMGEVYRARDTRLGREVALKILPADFAADADRLRRFEQEARTVGGLSHPNLVTLHDVGQHEGTPFLVMELLEGETLRSRLEGRPLPAKRAAEVARALAEGLAAAHERGILHRDLKPENVFLTRDGRVKILDFGLAKPQAMLASSEAPTMAAAGTPIRTGTGIVLGTMGYLSPEQVRGTALDARSDLFALGIILWEMLTGARPFAGSTGVETMHAILKEDPPDFDPALKVPPLLERIVRRCLEKEPAARFQSAKDLMFALEHMPGSGPLGGSKSTPAKLQPWLRWGWLCAGFAVAIACFFLGRWLKPPAQLKVEQLLPSPRIISSARFLPDGRSIVYTAAAEGAEAHLLGELFRLSPGEPPVSLNVKGCRIEDVSANGDLLLIIRRGPMAVDIIGSEAVLARFPASGATEPRVLQEGILSRDTAKWTRDGFGYVRKHVTHNNRTCQAFVYEGRALYEVPYGFGVDDFWFAGKGDAIRFVESRGNGHWLVTVGLDGVERQRSHLGAMELQDARPCRDGTLAIANTPHGFQLVVISEAGKLESATFTFPFQPGLLDVNQHGELLLVQRTDPFFSRVMWREPGADKEREVDVGGVIQQLRLDTSGRQLAMNETKNRPPAYIGHLIQAGQARSVRLPEGGPENWAPDGRSLLVQSTNMDGYIHLGILSLVGAPKITIPGQWIGVQAWMLPNGRVLILGQLAGTTANLNYLWEPGQAEVRGLEAGQSLTLRGPVSPDGRRVLAYRRTPAFVGDWFVTDLGTLSSTRIQGLTSNMYPINWTADGNGVWIQRVERDLAPFPFEIHRQTLATGRMEKVHTIQGPEHSWNIGWAVSTITPDGASYAYMQLVESQNRSGLFRTSGILR